MTGLAPALSTSVRGRYRSRSRLGHDRVCDIGDDGREGVSELRTELLQQRLVTGDTDDVGTGFGKRDGDAAAEAPACAGDDRRRSGMTLCGHLDLLNGFRSAPVWGMTRHTRPGLVDLHRARPPATTTSLSCAGCPSRGSARAR